VSIKSGRDKTKIKAATVNEDRFSSDPKLRQRKFTQSLPSESIVPHTRRRLMLSKFMRSAFQAAHFFT